MCDFNYMCVERESASRVESGNYDKDLEVITFQRQPLQPRGKFSRELNVQVRHDHRVVPTER